MKLKFNNDWLSLYAKSMGKVFLITHITNDKSVQDTLFKKSDMVSVACLPGDETTLLLANSYSVAFRAETLQDLNSDDRAYTGLYIEADKKYFQVAYVVTEWAQVKYHCAARSDIALVGIDNSGRHYLVSKQAAKHKAPSRLNSTDHQVKYENQDDWLNWCDRVSKARFGVCAIDLLDDTEAAINALQYSFSNDEEPDKAVSQVRKLQAKELWAKFGDTPINNDDEIESEFLHFAAGTDRFEIWHWFEETFDCSIAKELAI